MSDYLTMRNVACRFMKRWRLREFEGEMVWSMKVGGIHYIEPVLPGEVEAVRELETLED